VKKKRDSTHKFDLENDGIKDLFHHKTKEEKEAKKQAKKEAKEQKKAKKE